MRTIEEIQAEMLQYKKYEDVPKELRTEYNKISLQTIQQEEDERYKRKQVTENIPLDRLQEICNAERDGRLVVLPCKPDSILELRAYGKTLRYRFQGVRQQLNFKPELFGKQMFGERKSVGIANVDSFGKTVFLVEAAEQALKGGAKR